MQHGGIAPFIVEDRRMLSRVKADRIRLTHIVEPGERISGCLKCFRAPSSAQMLSYWCSCCFDYPKSILHKLHASAYVYVRENSIEWNQPYVQTDKGNCCGSSCCNLTIKDDVTVLYFDDLHFGSVRNQTRYCNECKTYVCGGVGEEVLIDSRFCWWGMCKRGPIPCICVPSFCPRKCCPCIITYEIFVEDAESAVQAIEMARDSAKERLV